MTLTTGSYQSRQMPCLRTSSFGGVETNARRTLLYNVDFTVILILPMTKQSYDAFLVIKYLGVNLSCFLVITSLCVCRGTTYCIQGKEGMRQ